MMFLIAGTQDGRELCQFLLQRGVDVTASVTTKYGEQLLSAQADGDGRNVPAGRLVIQDRPLDEAELAAYWQAHRITAVVDASHPYAVNVSVHAMQACQLLDIPYLRYERDITELSYPKIFVVHSFEEAAQRAAELGARVFLTTGSHTLRSFTDAPCMKGKTILARVLPTAEVLKLCEDAGLRPKQILAMQGPFSEAMNRVQFADYRADVIVTTNSGQIGGTDTKLAAAEALGLPVVLIDRPKLDYQAVAHRYPEVMEWLGQQNQEA